ncbi:hypothetical protein LJR034_008692 [Caballeronia sp. LjRoot34]|uniref:hypothetical protein n=1 Tax=Caballeronia sp. LjRoot34 TaxID=3342325 RepID=UPI003ECC5009
MFEAAKNRFYPEVFSTEEAARHYIGDAKADDVRPWIRRTDVKPMIDSFIVVAGKDVPRRVPRP